MIKIIIATTNLTEYFGFRDVSIVTMLSEFELPPPKFIFCVSRASQW